MKKHLLNAINNGILKVKVKPNSSKSEIKELLEDTVIIYLKSPAVDNKANEELLKLLKKELGIDFLIKSGKTSRNKVLEAV